MEIVFDKISFLELTFEILLANIPLLIEVTNLQKINIATVISKELLHY